MFDCEISIVQANDLKDFMYLHIRCFIALATGRCYMRSCRMCNESIADSSCTFASLGLLSCLSIT